MASVIRPRTKGWCLPPTPGPMPASTTSPPSRSCMSWSRARRAGVRAGHRRQSRSHPGGRQPSQRRSAGQSPQRRAPNLFTVKTMFQAARVVGRRRCARCAGRRRGAEVRSESLLGGLHARRADRQRASAAVPDLCRRKLHRGDGGHPLSSRSARHKYGKPILDRVAMQTMPLGQAASSCFCPSTRPCDPICRSACPSISCSINATPDRRRPTAHRQGRPLLQEALERLVEGVAERLRGDRRAG